MNILFSNKNLYIFDECEVTELANNFSILEKFKIKSLFIYFQQNEKKIERNLTKLDINNHFKLLYSAAKIGKFNVLNKHPLMISFLLKLKESEISKENLDLIKLSWVLMLYAKSELNINPISENALIKLIEFLNKDSTWINTENVELLLEVIMMVDYLKLINIKISNTILKFFDKENILNLMNYHILNANDIRNHKKILRILQGQNNLEFISKKNTNLFYIDFVITYFRKVISFLILFSFKFIECSYYACK